MTESTNINEQLARYVIYFKGFGECTSRRQRFESSPVRGADEAAAEFKRHVQHPAEILQTIRRPEVCHVAQS